MPKPTVDELALLKAVARDRDDDLPRLVYADWLEERGRTARAELIRLQIEDARSAAPTRGWSSLWSDRKLRIADLVSGMEAEWSRDLPKWAFSKQANERPVFVRGFVESFTVVGSLFFRHGPQLLDRAPVRRLKLVEISRLGVELARCVWLREVPILDLSEQNLNDDDLALWSDSEWLTGVQELDLSRNGIDDGAAQELAQCRYLTSIVKLNLVGNDIDYRGMQALARSPFLTSLREVWVGQNILDRRHAALLFQDAVVRE